MTGRTKPRRKKPRTAAQLLPLPPGQRHLISMQQHCALAAFRDGHGTADQIRVLARVVYLPLMMLRAETGGRADPGPYRTAEAMLYRCYLHGQAGEGWRLETDEAAHFAGLLTHFDGQLAACRAHCYLDALESLVHFERSGCSPLADPRAPAAQDALFRWLVEKTATPGTNG